MSEKNMGKKPKKKEKSEMSLVDTIRVEERREETETDDSFRTAFRYGSFERTRTVPPGTKLDEIEASYEDGILEVRVPIDEAKEAKSKIPIAPNQ